MQRVQLDNATENDSRIDHEYKPGDQVRIHFHNDDPRSKLLPATIGPFEVIATRSNGIVTINRGKFAENISIRRLLPA